MIQSLTTHQISGLVDGEVISQSGQGLVAWISIDSRNILEPSKTLFVALKGAKFDGHDFIKSVYEEGVRSFLIQKGNPVLDNLTTDSTFIVVDNPHEALQKLAAYERSLFSGPLVGITGSNGKTIVKEWLGQVLSQQFAVAKSPKSYNSQIGVPLSVWQLNNSHTLGIFEAGISTTGEMQQLASIIKP